MSQIVQGTTPLSRNALAWRFAAVAAISALLVLPLMPPEYFYHRADIFGYGGALKPGVHWRMGVLAPIAGSTAFVMAWVWSGGVGRVYFSPWRGLFCSLLTFLYSAVFVSFLGYWLSDETLPFFRLAVIGMLFLPFLSLIPVVGAVAGIVLSRGIPREPKNFRARLGRAAIPLLVTVGPLFAVLWVTRAFPPVLT